MTQADIEKFDLFDYDPVKQGIEPDKTGRFVKKHDLIRVLNRCNELYDERDRLAKLTKMQDQFIMEKSAIAADRATEISKLESQLAALTTENTRLTQALAKARKDADDDRRSAAQEANWKNSQGEFYGSY